MGDGVEGDKEIGLGAEGAVGAVGAVEADGGSKDWWWKDRMECGVETDTVGESESETLCALSGGFSASSLRITASIVFRRTGAGAGAGGSRPVVVVVVVAYTSCWRTIVDVPGRSRSFVWAASRIGSNVGIGKVMVRVGGWNWSDVANASSLSSTASTANTHPRSTTLSSLSAWQARREQDARQAESLPAPALPASLIPPSHGLPSHHLPRSTVYSFFFSYSFIFPHTPIKSSFHPIPHHSYHSSTLQYGHLKVTLCFLYVSLAKLCIRVHSASSQFGTYQQHLV